MRICCACKRVRPKSSLCGQCDQYVCTECDKNDKHTHEFCDPPNEEHTFDAETGKGDVEGMLCRPCDLDICTSCEQQHLNSAEHVQCIEEDEEERKLQEEQALKAAERAARKRKRQEEPGHVAKRAKLQVGVELVLNEYKTAKAAADKLKKELKEAKHALKKHEADA
jgi:hypothetical protein